MQEQRRFVRLNARLKIIYRVLDDGEPIQATTSSVSGSGLSFFAKAALPIGTRLQMEISLPEHERPTPLTAQVTWNQQSSMVSAGQRERSVELGVRFVEIAPADQETIMRYVESWLQPPSTT